MVRLLSRVFLPAALLAVCLPAAAPQAHTVSGRVSLAGAPSDATPVGIATASVTDSTFAVVWTTAAVTGGSVLHGTAPGALTTETADVRGPVPATTHMVLVTGLSPQTTYHFVVVSGGTPYDNGGVPFTVSTSPALLPPAMTAYGRIVLPDGAPVEGAVVRVSVRDRNGQGTPGVSEPLAAVTDADGWWWVGLGNVRTAGNQSLFDFSAAGDDVLIDVSGGADGAAAQTADTAAVFPAPDAVLPGAPVRAVLLTLASSATRTARPDGNGAFRFLSVPAGTWTLTPSLDNHEAAPPSRSYAPLSADMADQDFLLTPIARRLDISTDTAATAGVAVWTPFLGTGFYPHGSQVAASTTSPVEAAGVVYRCVGWTGTGSVPASGGGTSTTFEITADSTLRWRWEASGTIAGTVTLAGGTAPVTDVLLTLSGPSPAVAHPNAQGAYRFTDLSGGPYTVTPSLAGYTFSPPSRSYAAPVGLRTGQDFAGTLANAVTVTGYVKTPSGQGLGGVAVVFSNGGGAAVTQANGYYSQPVRKGYSGTAAPSHPQYAEMAFSPATRSYSNVTFNKAGQNYAGGLPVSGTVRGWHGAAVAGATVTFDGNQGQATTGTDGTYTVLVAPGWSGTAVPAKGGSVFDPVSRPYTTVSTRLTGEDYDAFVKVGGYARGVSGQPLAGTVVAFSGAVGDAAADGTGRYEHGRVPYGWSGTATPALAGYAFTPALRTYGPLTTSQTNQNYTGTTTVRISGRVTEDGAGLAGVTLKFLSGGTQSTVTTGVDGSYAKDVPENWSGDVTPSLAGYAFTPGSRRYTGIAADQENQDYAARRVWTIGGRVRTAAGAGVGGITVRYTGTVGGSAYSGQMNTGSDGAYSFGVPAGWTGTVSAAAAAYIVTPASRTYTDVAADWPDQNFTAAPAVGISGYIKNTSNAGIVGVTVTATGGYTASSAASGYYIVYVPSGWTGTAAPSKAGYAFTPASRTYATPVIFNKAGQNYTGY